MTERRALVGALTMYEDLVSTFEWLLAEARWWAEEESGLESIGFPWESDGR